MRIVIPGGSGQVGGILARHFHGKGHDVVVVARHPANTPWRSLLWDGRETGEWVREVDGADIVINLAGRSVNCRYNPANRREILESRVDATRAVGQAVAMAGHPPRIWINASTATIYRDSLDRDMDEATGEPGGNEPGVPETWRFSIQVAAAWERAFEEAPAPGTRKIALRSAMVMSPDRGGVFDTLRTLVRAGLGGPAGSGRQYVSWVHYTDFIRAIEFLIAREDLAGAINVSSPNPLPQRDFMRALRQACGTRIGLPATRWMLEIGAWILRTETELILKSRRVVPRRLVDAGFEFQYPFWKTASRDLVTSGPTPGSR